MTVAQVNRPDLRDAPFVSRCPPELGEDHDPFAAIRRQDLLLHHPYDSFGPVLHLLRRAAEDPDVLAIKMTLYRAGSNAEAVRTLIRAAENRKQVAVSIEIKARFDEENNMPRGAGVSVTAAVILSGPGAGADRLSELASNA
jgi:polyphosphate kinase